MNGIFISYRREDSGPYAGRLYDALVRQFEKDKVFLDVTSIDPGVDFRQAIERTLSSCSCLLAVIGKQWASITDDSGSPRLDSDLDYVRLEIALALEKNLLVIPVLVNGAEMPRQEPLPPNLKSLVYRNSWNLFDSRFQEDVQLLIQALKRSSVGVNSLFPLFGVTLGVTNVRDIPDGFERVDQIQNGKKLYSYFVWTDGSTKYNFWFDEETEIITHMYLTYSDPFPERWRNLGFRWRNSYEEWLAVLERNGYAIEVKTRPTVERYDGHDSFSAEVVARTDKTDPPLKLDLDFSFSHGTTVSAGSTLYSLRVLAWTKWAAKEGWNR